jgi:hypothetical protein
MKSFIVKFFVKAKSSVHDIIDLERPDHAKAGAASRCHAVPPSLAIGWLKPVVPCCALHRPEEG